MHASRWLYDLLAFTKASPQPAQLGSRIDLM